MPSRPGHHGTSMSRTRSGAATAPRIPSSSCACRQVSVPVVASVNTWTRSATMRSSARRPGLRVLAVCLRVGDLPYRVFSAPGWYSG